MREKDLLRSVIERARFHGWHIYHPLPAVVGKNQRTMTAQLGHSGFPDLVLLRPPRLIFAELKVGRNHPTVNQREWIDGLERVPEVEMYVWRDRDWPDLIMATLR